MEKNTTKPSTKNATPQEIMAKVHKALLENGNYEEAIHIIDTMTAGCAIPSEVHATYDAAHVLRKADSCVVYESPIDAANALKSILDADSSTLAAKGALIACALKTAKELKETITAYKEAELQVDELIKSLSGWQKKYGEKPQFKELMKP